MSGSLKDPGGCAGAQGGICALLSPFQTLWLMVLETVPAEEPGLTWCCFSLLWGKDRDRDRDRDQRHPKHCCCPRWTQQGLCCCTVSIPVLKGSCLWNCLAGSGFLLFLKHQTCLVLEESHRDVEKFLILNG